MSFGGVVLAGGHSRRMGCDKALVVWQGQTLLDRQVQVLRAAGASDIFISCRPHAGYAIANTRLVYDDKEGLGPLAGITACLRLTQQPHLLILAVDLVAMTANFLSKLLLTCRPALGVVPWDGSHYEPLAACYPREVLPLMERHLREGELSMQSVVHTCLEHRLVTLFKLTPQDRGLFRNCNTPRDLASP